MKCSVEDDKRGKQKHATYWLVKKTVIPFVRNFLFLAFSLFLTNSYAASYQWNGTVSSNWATATNWTPVGIPDLGDDVQILAAPNLCLLDINRTIDALTITSGTLDLGGNTLLATLNTVFTAGTVTNGTCNVVGSLINTATLTNPNFTASAVLNISTGRIFLNGGIYDGDVILEQTGNTNTGGTGGAIFNGNFSFTLSGNGYFRTNGNNIFNQPVSITNSGGDYVLFELTTGSVYNSSVTFTNNSTSQIRIAYQGNSQFNGNIEFNSTSTGEIRFCEQVASNASFGSSVALSIGGLGFASGQLILRKITQTDATPQNLILTGTASRIQNILNQWNGDVSFVAPRNLVEDCAFNGNTYLEKTQNDVDYCGGNIFNGTTTIVHSGFVNSFRFGRTNPDIFNGDVILHNLNDGHIRMADNSLGNQINGNLTVFNNSSNTVYFCNEGPSSLLINGNVQFNSTGASNAIIFGTAGNVITLNNGFAISNGVFDAGEIRFTDFVQLGSTPQTLSLSGTGNFTSNNSTWNGNISVIAPRLNTNNSTYNGTVFFEKIGNNDESSGGNTFNQITTLRHSANNGFRFGITNPDIFNADLFVRNTGTGRIELARNAAGNQFNGNVSVENSAGDGIWIGEGAGTSTLANGRTIFVGGFGFSDGQLRIANLIQIGLTPQVITTTSNSLLRLSGCTYNATLNYTSQRIFLIANVFNGVTSFLKNGTGDDNSAGGNIFNGTTTLASSSTDYFLMANVNPDIYNGTLTVSNTGTSIIYLSYNSTSNQFNGNVILESVGSNGIRIGDGGGTSTFANGVLISVGGIGFNSGELRFVNCTQLGVTAQSLTLAGTSRLMSMESVWNAQTTFISPRIYVRGSTFNNITYWEKTGATDDVSPGGNVFNGQATVANSGVNIVYFANTNPDIFNAAATFRSTGTSSVRMANASTGNQFNGNITVESTASAGVRFGQDNGSATLANGFTINVGGLGFDSGELRFRNFAQMGPTPQSLTLTGTGYILQISSEWNGAVAFSAPRYNTINTTHNATAFIEKTGASDDNSSGGNIFNGLTTLNNSGTGQFLMGNVNPDIFNGALNLTNTGTNYIYLSHVSTGNQYNGNITVQSVNSLGIRFGEGNGTSTLAAGQTVAVGGLGFNSGELRFRNFTQLGGTAQNITLSGTGRILSMESNWSGNVNFIAPRMYTRNTVYNGITSLTKTGATDDDSPGGNIFNAAATIANSGTQRFRMSTTDPDTFNATLLITNTGSSQIWMADVGIGNQFNGNIQVESVSSGGVFFGRGNGTATLAAGQTIMLGGLGFDSGELHLRNFTQLGATPQNIVLTGSGYINNYDSNWGGNVSFIAPRNATRGTTYNGFAYLEKNGAVNDASAGGNTFMQDVEFVVSGTGYFMPANTLSNTFMQDVTYVKTGAGLMYPSYNCESYYFGDINISSNTAITFGANTNGRIVMSGVASQQINDLGASPMPIFRRLTTNKTVGEVTLNIPIAVSVELQLISGVIHTSLANLLIMNNGSSVTAVSDAAHVNGPVRKIGNAAFTFPIGKNGFYRPASISAPGNAAHHFTAEYFFVDPVNHGYNDLALEFPLQYISDCEYWMINRTNGASNVSVTLSYKTVGVNGCSGVVDPTQLMVARWDGAIWRNHGNGGTMGIPDDGSIITAAVVTNFSPFTLATLDPINPLPIELITFNAVSKMATVELSWITKSETNNDYFVVERSADGFNFSAVGLVDGAGNSSSELSYRLDDTNPLIGTSYYRLKQVDFNGDFEYSEMRTVNFENGDSFTIYPNPAHVGQTIFVNNDNEDSDLNIVIFDAGGKIVFNQISEEKSINVVLTPGVYFVELRSSGIFKTQRLVIQN